MTKPVCIVTGVGPGTGSALARRFAKDYRVAMIARDKARLDDIAATNPNAVPFICDVSDEDAFGKVIEQIKTEMGAPQIVLHNAVMGMRGDFLEIDPDKLKLMFQINVHALLQLARATIPAMMEAGKGAFIATGNTSAHRGKAKFAALAPTKAAQRILMESIARRVGPEGVHAAFITIDGAIDVPWTREAWPDAPDDVFIQPDDIAAEAYHLAHQPKSTWTFDAQIRPFRETW